MRIAIALIIFIAIAAGAYFFFFAAGGGNLAAEAVAQQEAACAAETLDDAMEHARWFNETRALRADALEALSAADREIYDENRRAAFACQDALR